MINNKQPVYQHAFLREILYAFCYLIVQGVLIYGSGLVSQMFLKDLPLDGTFIYQSISLLLIAIPTLLLAIKFKPFRKWAILECTVAPILSLLLYKDAFAFLDIISIVFIYGIVQIGLIIVIWMIPVVILSTIIVVIKRALG